MPSYFPSNLGFLGVASQGAQKTTAKTTMKLYIPYLSEGFAPEIEEEIFVEGGNGKYMKAAAKTKHQEKVAFSTYLRPKVSAYMFAALLGKDTVTGGAVTTPYTHTVTVKTTDLTTTPMQKWLTFDKKFNSTNLARIRSAKISSITLEGEAGKPVKMTVEGTGLSGAIRTTVSTDTYETENPFSFYNGVYMVNASTTTNFDIASFNIKITAKNDEALQTVDLTRRDIINHEVQVDVTIGLKYTDLTMYKKANYGGGSAVTSDFSDGSVYLNMNYGSGASRRKFQMQIPKVHVKPHAIQLDPKVKTMEQPYSGIGFKLPTTDLVTVTCWNSLTTTLPL